MLNRSMVRLWYSPWNDAARATKVRHDIADRVVGARQDKGGAADRVVEASRFVCRTCPDKRLHGIERVEPHTFRRDHVKWFRQI